MAAPYTDAGTLTNLLATAIDRKMHFAARSMPKFRDIADTKPTDLTNPGTSVIFQEYADLAPATTPLNEITDPTGVALANPSRVTVTLEEYGNYTVVTKKLQEFALDKSLDSSVATILANNLVDSVDALVKAKLDASTNVIREVGTTLTPGAGVVTGVTTSSLFASKHVRYATAKMRGNNVPGVRGDIYGAYIHPDVAHDLRAETGTAAWRDPHVYSKPEDIWAAELGQYEGVFFVETPRATITADAGASSTVDVYNTYLFGKMALAEVVAEEFHAVVNGVVVDPLRRKTPIGWYGIAGWGLFRSPNLTVVKTASSIGANS